MPALDDEGSKTRQIAERLGVSPAYRRRVKQRRHEPPRRITGRRPKLDETACARLIEWVADKPDATLEELRSRVLKDPGLRVRIGALWNTLHRRMKLSLKKVADRP